MAAKGHHFKTRKYGLDRPADRGPADPVQQITMASFLLACDLLTIERVPWGVREASFSFSCSSEHPDKPNITFNYLHVFQFPQASLHTSIPLPFLPYMDGCVPSEWDLCYCATTICGFINMQLYTTAAAPGKLAIVSIFH